MGTPLSRAMDQMAEADELREENARLRAENADLQNSKAETWHELDVARAKLVEARDKLVAHAVNHPGPCCVRSIMGLDILGNPTK